MRTEIDVLSEIMCSNVSKGGCASCKHEPTCFVRKFAERAIKAGYAQCENRDIRLEAAERAVDKLMSFIGCNSCPCDKVICDRAIARDPKQVEQGYPACTAKMLKLCSMEIEGEDGNPRGDTVSTIDEFTCGVCGFTTSSIGEDRKDEEGDIREFEYEFKYCPNCGAKVHKA